MRIVIFHDNGIIEDVECCCAMVIARKSNAREPAVEYTGKLYGVYGGGDPEAMAKVARLAARRYEDVARGGR